jgi:hypothetical protein
VVGDALKESILQKHRWRFILVWKDQGFSTNIPAFASEEVPDTEFLVRSVKVFNMVCDTVARGTPATNY